MHEFEEVLNSNPVLQKIWLVIEEEVDYDAVNSAVSSLDKYFKMKTAHMAVVRKNDEVQTEYHKEKGEVDDRLRSIAKYEGKINEFLAAVRIRPTINKPKIRRSQSWGSVDGAGLTRQLSLRSAAAAGLLGMPGMSWSTPVTTTGCCAMSRVD